MRDGRASTWPRRTATCWRRSTGRSPATSPPDELHQGQPAEGPVLSPLRGAGQARVLGRRVEPSLELADSLDQAAVGRVGLVEVVHQRGVLLRQLGQARFERGQAGVDRQLRWPGWGFGDAAHGGDRAERLLETGHGRREIPFTATDLWDLVLGEAHRPYSLLITSSLALRAGA